LNRAEESLTGCIALQLSRSFRGSSTIQFYPA